MRTWVSRQEVEALAAVEMLLSDIHAAGIADRAVDHGDLPMVAVADRMQPVERRVGAIRIPAAFISRHSRGSDAHVSQRIIEQPHLDARLRLLDQDLLQALGEWSAPQMKY